MLQTCKLAQKIPNAILRRMLYSLSGNKQYLKSHLAKLVLFRAFWWFFLIFPDFVAVKRRAGPIESV